MKKIGELPRERALQGLKIFQNVSVTSYDVEIHGLIELR
jgi:hypothetical protein